MSPTQISTPRAIQISGTYVHMLALTHNGAVHGWGYNVDHQVNSSAGHVLAPVLIPNEVSGLRARQVATGTTSS